MGWQSLISPLPFVQIVEAVCTKKQSLDFPSDVPAGYARLAASCMAFRSEDRPNIDEVAEVRQHSLPDCFSTLPGGG